MKSVVAKNIAIKITTEVGSYLGSAQLNVCTKAEAAKKGLLWLAACWGGALCAVPIPLVHFVAVPIGVLAGPIVGYVIFRMHHHATDLSALVGNCPSCQKSLLLGTRAANWPVPFQCPACQAHGTVTIASDGPRL